MAVAAHAHHAATHNRLAMNTVGLWFFFISECFLFGALLAARFYLAGTDRPEHLDQNLGLAITSVLLASSFTAYLAETAMSQRPQRSVRPVHPADHRPRHHLLCWCRR